jgi:ATP-dependent protease Clp ATPase subunit
MTESQCLYTCSFCKNPNDKVIAGPGVYICFSCATSYTDLVTQPVDVTSRRSSGLAKCSFCGRTEPTVARVMEGADATICNDCLRLCNDIIGEPQRAV